MIGFETVATTGGLIIGAILGLLPLGAAIYFKKYMPGILGWFACVLSGFMCGFFGGIPMIILTTAVVISYAYVNKQDPFTSLASIEEVDFTETNGEFFMRQMASLGRTVRLAIQALVRNTSGFIGFVGLVFFITLTTIGPLFVEYEGEARYDRLQPGQRSLSAPPSEEHPLGLDWQGRDIFSHIVHGGQQLIMTAIQAGIYTTVIAVIFGALAALLGGIVDQLLSAVSNFVLTIPQFPLLLVLAAVLQFESGFALALLLAALNWPTLMRAVRAQVLSLKERDYVEAAIALDLGTWHIISREVFPNMISYIAINMIFSVRAAMYAVVGLVILGMVPLKEPDWGIMIFMGRQQGAFTNADAAYQVMAPIIAIALFQLSLVLFTRSLEEFFNPRLRSGL